MRMTSQRFNHQLCKIYIIFHKQQKADGSKKTPSGLEERYIYNSMMLFFSSLSGPEDDVFVYLVDHGGPGFVGFIDGYVSFAHQTYSHNLDNITHMYFRTA